VVHGTYIPHLTGSERLVNEVHIGVKLMLTVVDPHVDPIIL